MGGGAFTKFTLSVMGSRSSRSWVSLMWDCQREYSNTGRNANILKQWYRKYKARGDRVKLHDRIARIQAVFRGTKTREFVKKKMNVLCRFQAAFRGLRGRRQWR